MAPHSSTLAWKVSCTEEPGGLQSLGSHESDTTEILGVTLCSIIIAIPDLSFVPQ